MLDGVVNLLINKNKTISILDSLTAGLLSSELTNCEGVEKIFLFSAVPYNKEYKIKFGVRETTINEFTENSVEVSKEMARCVSAYTNSDFGIGITGNLSRKQVKDPMPGEDTAFIAIYKKETNQVYVTKLRIENATYKEKKNDVITFVRDTLMQII